MQITSTASENHYNWIMAHSFIYGMDFQANWEDRSIPPGDAFPNWYVENFPKRRQMSLADAYRSFMIQRTETKEPMFPETKPHLYNGYTDEECLKCDKPESDAIHIEPDITIYV